MKLDRFFWFLGLLLFTHLVFAQRSQTILTTEARVQVDKIADSSLVFLYPTLKEARVTLKNGDLTQASLNYSILLDEMHMQTRRGIQAVETRDLKKIEIEGSTFVFKEGNGYFEVLLEGRYPLYLKRNIRTSALPVRRGAYGGTDHTSAIDLASNIQTTNNHHGSEIFLENPSGQELEIILRYQEFFFFEKDGTLLRVNNARQLQRDFPEHRNELRDFMRSESINFSNRQDLLKLGKFMEGLK